MSVFTNPASGSREHASAYIRAILDLLGAQDPNAVLKRTERALRRAIDGLSRKQLTQPEAQGKWSIRHVVQHLADSELVWGYRLRTVLGHDRPVLTGYDQDSWAAQLHYDQVDAGEALETFAALRRANLRLLGGLEPEELKRVGVHSERGDESVEHMMKLYAGHDLLHLNQIARIKKGVA